MEQESNDAQELNYYFGATEKQEEQTNGLFITPKEELIKKSWEILKGLK